MAFDVGQWQGISPAMLKNSYAGRERRAGMNTPSGSGSGADMPVRPAAGSAASCRVTRPSLNRAAAAPPIFSGWGRKAFAGCPVRTSRPKRWNWAYSWRAACICRSRSGMTTPCTRHDCRSSWTASFPSTGCTISPALISAIFCDATGRPSNREAILPATW